jgi:hypothetical protein
MGSCGIDFRNVTICGSRPVSRPAFRSFNIRKTVLPPLSSSAAMPSRVIPLSRSGQV